MFLTAAALVLLQIPPDQYLLSGTISNDHGERAFVVAVLGDHALSGLGSPDETDLIWTGANKKIVQITLASGSSGSSDWTSLPFKSVGLSDRSAGSAREERFMAIQTAPFSVVSFAVFFSSAYCGVSQSDVRTRETLSNPYGKLTVRREGDRIAGIEFSQEASDILSPTAEGMTLADTKHRYPDGMSRIQYSCKFTPPLSSSMTNWVAECSRDKVEMDGTVHRRTSKVTVERFITDPALIEQEIQGLLALVPEGHRVLTGPENPIAYVWRDGKVVRQLDTAAIRKAEQLKFEDRNSGSRMALIIGNTLLALVISWFLYRRWKRAE